MKNKITSLLKIFKFITDKYTRILKNKNENKNENENENENENKNEK